MNSIKYHLVSQVLQEGLRGLTVGLDGLLTNSGRGQETNEEEGEQHDVVPKVVVCDPSTY